MHTRVPLTVESTLAKAQRSGGGQRRSPVPRTEILRSMWGRVYGFEVLGRHKCTERLPRQGGKVRLYSRTGLKVMDLPL